MRIGIYAWAGLGNIGDDWLLQTSIKLLSPVVESITIITEPKAKLGEISSGHRVLSWPRLSAERDDRKNFWREVNDLDLVLFAGGGWLAGDQGPREPINWALRVRNIKTATAAMCIGVGPYRSILLRKVGGYVLKKITSTNLLTVRTAADQFWVTNISSKTAELMTDLSLFDESIGSGVEARSLKLISLPEISPRWLDGESPDECAMRFVDILDDEFLSECKFISFQSGEHEDSIFWAKYFKNVISVRNPNEAMSILRQTETFVSGRLHSTLAAILCGVPNIRTIGYHHKFDVLKDLSLPVTDWQELELESGSVNPNLLAAISRLGKRTFVESVLSVGQRIG